MGMIDRYKKQGGFLQLVQLIETTGSPKREQFLKIIGQEAPNWEAAVKQKMISLERMTTWNASYLMEFIPQIPHMAIACGIYPFPEDKRTIFLSALGFGDRKKVEGILKEHKPNSGEIASSQMKIIGEVRKLAATGKIKFEKFDPELHVPEDIEESLKSGGFISAVASEVEAASPSISTTALGPTAPGVGNLAAVTTNNDEALALRRKLVALTQENTRLIRENKEVKDKLDQIKAAVQKIA